MVTNRGVASLSDVHGKRLAFDNLPAGTVTGDVLLPPELLQPIPCLAIRIMEIEGSVLTVG